MMDRRDFLKTGASAVGASALSTLAAPAFVPASALGKAGRPAPSERVTMGMIGTGNQGMNNLFNFLPDPRVQVVAVCDVNRGSAGYWDGRYAGREPARQIVEWEYAREKRSGKYAGCADYEDFRRLLARTDIDTVCHSLPDHWHGIVTVETARAGKDMYGEKPLSLNVAEGRAMSDAVAKYGRIFQTGSQQRSAPEFWRMCELVRNGRIGKVHTVRIGLPGGTPDFGRTAHRKVAEPVPEGFNYDLWLGPAPLAPYCPARCHVNYRWMFDYSGGQVTDWGGHHPDIAQWGLDRDNSGPVEIRNPRAVFSKEAPWDTAVEFYFEAVYDDGVVMIISNEERHGVTFEGSEGWIWASRGNFEASSQEIHHSEIGPDEIRLYRSEHHHRNFIDCVLSREQPAAPIEAAHRSITIAHLGNIAMRLGRGVKWNPETEEIIGDAEASKMLSKSMREPWKIGV